MDVQKTVQGNAPCRPLQAFPSAGFELAAIRPQTEAEHPFNPRRASAKRLAKEWHPCVARRLLHRSCCSGISLSRSIHAQRPVRSSVIVKADPVPDHAAGVLQAMAFGQGRVDSAGERRISVSAQQKWVTLNPSAASRRCRPRITCRPRCPAWMPAFGLCLSCAFSCASPIRLGHVPPAIRATAAHIAL